MTAAVQTEQLQERVDELERLLGLRDIMPIDGLPPTAAQLLGLLMRRQLCSRELIEGALWAGADLRTSKTVDMHLGFVRRFLARHAVTLHSRWGAGWYLEERDKARLRAALPQLAQRRPAHQAAS